MSNVFARVISLSATTVAAALAVGLWVAVIVAGANVLVALAVTIVALLLASIATTLCVHEQARRESKKFRIELSNEVLDRIDEAVATAAENQASTAAQVQAVDRRLTERWG